MTLTAPSVLLTAVVTVPFESSVRVWPPVASVALWRTKFLKVARVPDEAGRKIRTIGRSGPPTWFQLVSLPVQTSVSCWVVRLVTPVTSLLVTTIQPWRATMWSTSLAASGALSLLSAVTSESPIWTPPAATWVSPVPDPPPLMVMVAPTQAAAYCLAAASTRGCRAVEPEAVMLPVTHVVVAAGVAVGAPVFAAVVPVGGGVVAVGEAPAEVQADAKSAAAIASAPKRRVPFSNVHLLLTGRPGNGSSPIPGSKETIKRRA